MEPPGEHRPMAKTPAEQPATETREVVEGRHAATPFAFISSVGFIVLGFAALVILAVFVITWLL